MTDSPRVKITPSILSAYFDVIMNELTACRNAYKANHVPVIANDNKRQTQDQSMVVCRDE